MLGILASGTDYDLLAVVQVNGCLYRVHKHFFVSEAGFFMDMFALPQLSDAAGESPKEGTTDDTAIIIPDVTCREFEALLDFFYYRFVQPHCVCTLLTVIPQGEYKGRDEVY
jgi:hypothetical protein